MASPEPPDPFDQLDDPEALRDNPRVLKFQRGGPKSRELSLRPDYAFNVSSLDDIVAAYDRFAEGSAPGRAPAKKG